MEFMHFPVTEIVFLDLSECEEQEEASNTVNQELSSRPGWVLVGIGGGGAIIGKLADD